MFELIEPTFVSLHYLGGILLADFLRSSGESGVLYSGNPLEFWRYEPDVVKFLLPLELLLCFLLFFFFVTTKNSGSYSGSALIFLLELRRFV